MILLFTLFMAALGIFIAKFMFDVDVIEGIWDLLEKVMSESDEAMILRRENLCMLYNDLRDRLKLSEILAFEEAFRTFDASKYETARTSFVGEEKTRIANAAQVKDAAEVQLLMEWIDREIQKIK